MKYIHKAEDDSIMFDRYQSYILPLKDKIPQEFRDIATEARFYDLSSPESLHDARVHSIHIAEDAEARVRIELLGAQRFILEYSGVTEYCVKGPQTGGARHADSCHGDLYTHEFRIEGDGIFTHEIVFTSGASICVLFTSLRYQTEEYPASEGG